MVALIGVAPLALFVAHGMLRPVPPRALAAAAVLREVDDYVPEVTSPPIVPLIEEPLPSPQTPVPTAPAVPTEVPRPDPTPVDPVPEIARAGGVRTAVALLVTDANAGRRPRPVALRQALDLALRGGLDEDAAELARRLVPDPALDPVLPWIVARRAESAGIQEATAFLATLLEAGYAAERPIVICRAILAAAAGETGITAQDPDYWDRILPCLEPSVKDCHGLESLVSRYPDDALLRMFQAAVLARSASLTSMQGVLAGVRERIPESVIFVMRLEALVLAREGRGLEAAARESEIRRLEGNATARSW